MVGTEACPYRVRGTRPCRGLGLSLRSENSLESPFDKGGLRGLGPKGLKARMETVRAGFSSLYPPYGWIPASAAMTKEGARDFPLPGSGVSPDLSYLPQEWGTGVGSKHGDGGTESLGTLDSRFRGNDRRGRLLRASFGLTITRVPKGCAEGRSPFAEGLGASPNSLFSPQEWGPGG